MRCAIVPDDRGSGATRPERLVVDFADRVRREGLAVPPGSAVEYGRALGALRSTRLSAVYWAGRATLVRRPDDIPPYDRAFAAFFAGADDVLARSLSVPVQLHVDAPDAPEGDDGGDDDSDDESAAGEVRTLRWSATELLRHKDLSQCTADELAEAHRLMADLRVHAALRRSRRRRRTSRHRGHPDLRRTVARSLRTGGEVVRPAASERGERGQVEVFALGTRVTRISHELATHDPDAALRRAADAVADWSGGTRLGDGLRTFNDRWGVRGLARGAVVVVLSDGWDRGDPTVLGSELARLRRVAYRLVWVNPLKASPGFAPLAQGMAAALPHVDEFVEGHSVASLEALAELVAR